ncbi:MAG: hypothetical protein M3Y56_14175 [Armatimonadota bacterium]|nr:hypothetical protein [Armatimonadota bacterium]
MSALPEESIVSSIRLRTGKGGSCRVFIVQARNRAEVNHAQQLFAALEEYCSVRALTMGVTTAFAVQSAGELQVLNELEQILKDDFKFSVVYSGFNPVIHRIVEDLAVETGSRLLTIPSCHSCGEPVPFPARLSTHGPGGKARAKALFCDRCVANVSGESEAEEFCRMVEGDQVDITTSAATPVVRKRSLMRFRFSRPSSPKPPVKVEEGRGSGERRTGARPLELVGRPNDEPRLVS